jgi:hypothetical protein
MTSRITQLFLSLASFAVAGALLGDEMTKLLTIKWTRGPDLPG